MLITVLSLIATGFCGSVVATAVVLRWTRARDMFDSAPVAGQAKEASRRIPNTGGIGVFLAIVVPMILGLAFAVTPMIDAIAAFLPDLTPHIEGLRSSTPVVMTLIIAITALHLLGVVDDRKPIRPFLKLFVMAGVCTAVVIITDTRLLTLLDGAAGGSWLSVMITVGWMLAVVNAMNFVDNMDGQCAGIASVAGACCLVAAIASEQWFVASGLSLLVGACAGFLAWNKPPAKIFLGDGGSLVIGFLLALLIARTTYFGPTPTGRPTSGAWYGIFMPLLVLATPLYDLVSVVIIRISQGRSPMVGDLQHLAHRLVKRGLSKPQAVGLMVGLTGATGLGGLVIGHLPPWGAVLIASQTILLLLLLAVLELGTSPKGARRDSLEVDDAKA